MAQQIKLGDLKYSVEIQQPTVEVDENGIPQQTWKTIRTTRAKVESNYNSKLEKDNFDGTNYFDKKEFTIRKLYGIKGTDCRLIYKNRKFDILLMEEIDEDGLFIRLVGQEEKE